MSSIYEVTPISSELSAEILEKYPIDVSKTSTIRIFFPEITTRGLLYINEIDITDINVNKSIFTHTINPTTTKLYSNMIEFDVPWNTVVSIQLRMDDTLRYNLSYECEDHLGNNLTSDQPYLSSAKVAFGFPTVERPGYLVANSRYLALRLYLYPAKRIICTPLQAPTENLRIVPVLINTTGEITDYTLTVNGIGLKTIFSNYTRSPYKFKALTSYISTVSTNTTNISSTTIDRTYTLEPHAVDQEVSPYAKEGAVFVIFYVPKDSFIELLSPLDSTNPTQVSFPEIITDSTGEPTCLYYEDFYNGSKQLSKDIKFIYDRNNTAISLTERGGDIKITSGDLGYIFNLSKITVIEVHPPVYDSSQTLFSKEQYTTCIADPLAQSFFIDEAVFTEGVFISSIDLFFRRKDDIQPIMIELRPSVNGYPSSKEVIPFSRCFKPASEVEVSEDASKPTNFKLEGIVYLQPGEYHFVVQSRSLEYEAWIGRLGEYILGDPTKGRIVKNPYAGVLAKSSNNTAWLPDSDADFKFRINRCKFTLGETEVSFNSNNYNSKARTETPLDVTLIKPAFATIVPTETRFSKSLVTMKNKSSDTFKEFSVVINENSELDSVYKISDTKFDTTNMVSHKVGLYTNKDNVSPIIDWQQSSYVLVNNLINTISDTDTTELQNFGGVAMARYITKPMQLNQEIPATNLRIEFAANTPMGTRVRVYYRVYNTLHDSNNLSINNKNWIYLDSFKRITKNKNTFIDATFETPNPIQYIGIPGLIYFDVCQIKLVLDSVNPVFVPRVRDLRLIALSN